MRKILFWILCLHSPFAAFATELPLTAMLAQAESADPRMRSERQRELAADEEIRLRKAGYYPTVNAALIASTGDPGSFAFMDVDGDISAANRIGAGGALVLKQNIWDFGRTSKAVELARLERQLTAKQSSVSRLNIDHEIMSSYLECSFLKTQLEDSRFVVQRLKLLANETDRFVKSGQRSVIERYLMDSEVKAAETRVAESEERLKSVENQLRILTQFPSERKVTCQKLEPTGGEMDRLGTETTVNPLLEIQSLKSETAQARLARARAEGHPSLSAMAMAGVFDNDHLKDRTNYAVGIGLNVPLFQGFGVDADVGKRDAELKAEEFAGEGARQEVEKANSRFDEKILSLGVRLKFLESERKHAEKVFDLAHRRYEDLQGTMTDLREAIQSANRIFLSVDETLRDLLMARGEKALFNGLEERGRR